MSNSLGSVMVGKLKGKGQLEKLRLTGEHSIKINLNLKYCTYSERV
jgi:hypothetical protein